MKLIRASHEKRKDKNNQDIAMRFMDYKTELSESTFDREDKKGVHQMLTKIRRIKRRPVKKYWSSSKEVVLRGCTESHMESDLAERLLIREGWIEQQRLEFGKKKEMLKMRKQFKFYKRLDLYKRSPVVLEFNSIRENAMKEVRNPKVPEKDKGKIISNAVKRATDMLLQLHNRLREWTEKRKPNPLSDETSPSSKESENEGLSWYQKTETIGRWNKEEVSNYGTPPEREYQPQDHIHQIVYQPGNGILNHVMIETMLEMTTSWRRRGLSVERKPTYFINADRVTSEEIKEDPSKANMATIAKSEDIREDFQRFIDEYKAKNQKEYPFMKSEQQSEVEIREVEISRIEKTSGATSETELSTPRNIWRTVEGSEGSKAEKVRIHNDNYSNSGSESSSTSKRPRNSSQQPRSNPNDRQSHSVRKPVFGSNVREPQTDTPSRGNQSSNEKLPQQPEVSTNERQPSIITSIATAAAAATMTGNRELPEKSSTIDEIPVVTGNIDIPER
jgi:hypothetical protein